jgi:hypothetical protein
MTGEATDPPSPFNVFQDSVRRFGARGWRSITILALSLICVLTLLSTIRGGDSQEELIQVVHNEEVKVARPPILEVSSPRV